MGRIIANVSIKSLFEPDLIVQCDALVDTGAAHMVFPKAWKSRLGKLNRIREIDCETAAQQLVKGEVSGPVEIKIEGFDPVYSEILFLDMEPEDGIYEPLIGYIILEQAQAAVDMVGHRLLHVKKADLK
jgi:predicted aspartyl protease